MFFVLFCCFGLHNSPMININKKVSPFLLFNEAIKKSILLKIFAYLRLLY